jgi:molecular chaperone HscC
MTKENHRIAQIRFGGLRCQPGKEEARNFEVRFSYDMNGILEVEVTLHDGRKLMKVIEQRPGTMTEDQIAAAIARLGPLKAHPREQPANRARLERSSRLFSELTGDLRRQLTLLTDAFEAALMTQNATHIQASGAGLDGFMAPYYDNE